MIIETFGCNKPTNFIELYKRELEGLNPKRILEIGVQTGKSLRMWANAFPEAEIVGLDINDIPGSMSEKNIRFVKGDQCDEVLLHSLGEFDIIIDDGSHMMTHQQKSFNILFHKLKEGGLYFIEDLETSFMKKFIDGELTTDFIHKLSDTIHTGGMIKRITTVKYLTLIEKI